MSEIAIKEQGIDINQNVLTLEDFAATVDASKPLETVHYKEEAPRNLARRNVHTQLCYLLELSESERQFSEEQLAVVDAYRDHVYSPEFQSKPLTEKEDVSKALKVLSALGFDISKQKKQMEDTW